MSNIDKIYELLNCQNKLEDQLHGINLARNLDDLSVLILPCWGDKSKFIWANCAIALYEISDERLEKYLPDLLEWLQDFNWPGALKILERLKSFSGEKLLNPFVDCVAHAIGLNNEEGLMWLDHLSELLDNENLKSLLPESILKRMQKHYHNWCFWYTS